MHNVAPVRERGLKLLLAALQRLLIGRSREGAWIEILITLPICIRRSVAPVRERGLKCPVLEYLVRLIQRRSREGAWIEIVDFEVDEKIAKSLP